MSRSEFPLGAKVRAEDLEADPYPVYARLRVNEPVSWIESLGMWYITRYNDVKEILIDQAVFSTNSKHSLIYDTFGAQMLSVEAAEHARYRGAFQPTFLPSCVREKHEVGIDAAIRRLLSEFETRGEAEMRSELASRLPIHVILSIFGLEISDEANLRRWYDTFERALGNFAGDPKVRDDARKSMCEWNEYLDDVSKNTGAGRSVSFLSGLAGAGRSDLDDAEIKRNMSIVFFGGISTVEALLLNILWALFEHPRVMERVRADLSMLTKVIDESLRWLSPVQSATRHVTIDTTFRGVGLKQGDIVNCMIASANRDPSVFADPDTFDIDRANLHRHLAFASGTHACLGFHLAKAEVRLALRQLLHALPGLRLLPDRSEPPRGYEFRQSRRLTVAWDIF